MKNKFFAPCFVAFAAVSSDDFASQNQPQFRRKERLIACAKAMIINMVQLNFNTYPLYVGIEEVSRDARWQDCGSTVVLEAWVESDQFCIQDIIWENEDDFILNMKPLGPGQVRVQAVRTGIAKVTASLPDGT
ncbi:MAG: hypothetical protein IJ315_02205, partial [Firmicutes bacterium]|nr:hypothetical protein [Bacillota bacterium]